MKKLILGLSAALLCAIAPLPAFAGPVEDAKTAFASGQNERGVSLLKDAAQQGNADAQSELAWLYSIGSNVPQSYKTAAMWTLKAAEQGDARAQYAMYNNYESGRGVEKSEEKSIYWLKRSAENGLKTSQYAYANRLHHGRGVQEDVGTAIIWYKKAASQGHSTAQKELEGLQDWQAPKTTPRQELARLNKEKKAEEEKIKMANELLYAIAVNDFQNGNVGKAISAWERLASEGHYGSQLSASLMFMNGKLIEKSISKADSYLTSASNNPYTNSFSPEEKNKLAAVQAAFSQIYEGGNSTPANENKSFFWMEKAAQSGLPTAMFLTGANYELGKGTEPSKEQAIFWYKRAAANGYAGAQNELARLSGQ